MALITKEYLEDLLLQQMHVMDIHLPDKDKDETSIQMSEEGAKGVDDYLIEMGIDPMEFMSFTLDYLMAGHAALMQMGPMIGGGSLALRFFTLGVVAGRDNPL